MEIYIIIFLLLFFTSALSAALIKKNQTLITISEIIMVISGFAALIFTFLTIILGF